MSTIPNQSSLSPIVIDIMILNLDQLEEKEYFHLCFVCIYKYEYKASH